MELEYKYVVCNQDGHPSQWKPGNNYSLTIPAPPGAAEGEVAVMDAWDGSIHDVQLMGMHDVQLVGLDAEGQEVALTEEQEIAAVRSLVRCCWLPLPLLLPPLLPPLLPLPLLLPPLLLPPLPLPALLPLLPAVAAGPEQAAARGVAELRGPCLPLQASKAVAEVLSNMEASAELQQQLGDPAAPELLLRDRQVAASVSKLVGRRAAARRCAPVPGPVLPTPAAQAPPCALATPPTPCRPADRSAT
jgi:hypothetical protein